MKSGTLTCITMMTLFAALALPMRVAAQEQQQSKPQPRYKLVDLGTFGGPGSGVSGSFLSPWGGVPVINNQGTVVGSSDTATEDPSCFFDDCYYPNAFQWQNGVLTNLGALPGSQWSSTDWISGSGLITGWSENGATDPLTGVPEIRAVFWRGGQIVDLGTLAGGYESGAFAVNDRGQVVGFATYPVLEPFGLWFGAQTRAILWQQGVMQDLGTLGGPDAGALLVNERGQIAGVSYTNSTPNPSNGSQCGSNVPTQDPFLWEKAKWWISAASEAPAVYPMRLTTRVRWSAYRTSQATWRITPSFGTSGTIHG